MFQPICPHAASGCDYPSGECVGLCMPSYAHKPGVGLVLTGGSPSKLEFALQVAKARGPGCCIALGRDVRPQVLKAAADQNKTVIFEGRPTKSEVSLIESAITVLKDCLFIICTNSNLTWISRAGCPFTVMELK